jgi:hypothetical protein
MAPDNRTIAELMVKQLESWDSELQLIEQEGYGAYERSDGWLPDHINVWTLCILFVLKDEQMSRRRTSE